MEMHIVKRRGKLEKFDTRKVYASCYAACLTSHIKKQDAEKICEKLSKEIRNWIKDKKKVTSDQIFKEVTKVLRKYNKDAAFMYKTHRDVS